jgi:hypothetical protein
MEGIRARRLSTNISKMTSVGPTRRHWMMRQPKCHLNWLDRIAA